ncbi:MAG: PAS domain S-box protein, partial [Candidatus Thorarchaeota archaeon]
MNKISNEENLKEETKFIPHPAISSIINDNNWYKTLVETMVDGIIASDMNRNIVFVNPSACKKLGYKKEELLGTDSLAIVIEEDRNRVIRESELRFSDKSSSQYEVTFKTKVGSRLPVLVSASPILGKNGHTVGTYAIITDIRDRKIVEKELRDKNTELQTLYNNLLQLYEQLGAILAETINVHTEILLFTSKHCVYCAPAEEVLQEVLTSYGGKITYRKVDVDKEPDLADKYEILSLPTIVIGDEKLTSVPDIYKLHSALFSALVPEEKFRRTRQELDNIINYSPVAIFTINSKGIITSCNPLLEIMTDQKRKDLVGNNVIEKVKGKKQIFHNAVIKLFERGLKGENISVNRLMIKDISEESYDSFSIVSIKVVPMATKEGEINEILVLCEDVTTLALQEEELSNSYNKLEELNDKLLQMNKDRSNFVELTTTKLIEPLRNSKELLETMLSGQLGELGEATFGTLEFLRNNLDRVSKSMSAILEFSNIEAQDFTLKLGKHNVKNLISEALSSISSVGIDKSFIATLEVDDNLIAWCDQEHLVRILKNLISNAIQFSTIDCRIEITAKNTDNKMVSISVKDNGYGIEKDNLEKIFEQYV